jgi:phosphoglycolate phosphatase
MSIKNIFIDLDGTILDSKLRLFLLFKHLVPDCDFTFNEYWELKQNMYSHETILIKFYNYNLLEIEYFHNKWNSNIELDHWLHYDTLIEGVHKTFDFLISNNYKLLLLTSRQSKINTKYQLDRLNLTNYFNNILITENKASKYELIKTCNLNGRSMIIGDTGVDIEVGKKFNFTTVSVLSGFRNLNSLNKYNPDYIIENFNQIITILNY